MAIDKAKDPEKGGCGMMLMRKARKDPATIAKTAPEDGLFFIQLATALNSFKADFPPPTYLPCNKTGLAITCHTVLDLCECLETIITLIITLADDNRKVVESALSSGHFYEIC